MNEPMSSGSALTPRGAKIEKPKGWVVLSADEKIERLREILKQNAYQFNRIYQLESKVQKLRQLLVKHSHNGTEVVSKVEEYDNLGGESLVSGVGTSKENPNEVYF